MMKGEVVKTIQRLLILLALAGCARPVDSLTARYPADECAACEEWNTPHEPFRIFGDLYYVGTEGLSSLLLTSSEGHVLIDAGLPASAPHIIENIRSLGFDIADIRMILNSHAHFDHAGGIAAVRSVSGARVIATAASAPTLQLGSTDPSDPQYGLLLGYPAAGPVEVIEEGQVVGVGLLTLTAHRTPGHTPGGTTWSWRSCEGSRCLDFVYADSLTPVSRDDFRFSDHPSIVADFERGFAVLERLPCDVLITPHPDASDFWSRWAAGIDSLVDPGACARYVAAARERLTSRLASEGAD